MIRDQIIEKINTAFHVHFLEVVNESHMHNVPEGSESHFKVVLVSDDFLDLNKVKQHQAVYKVLAEEMASKIHALALHTFDISQWQSNAQAPDSPNCLGGDKKAITYPAIYTWHHMLMKLKTCHN